MSVPRDPLTDGLDHRTLTEIQRKVVKQGKRHAASRFVLARSDKNKIAAWKQDLLRVLNVFNVGSIIYVGHSLICQPFRTELVIDIHEMVADMHPNVLTGQEGASSQGNSVGITCHPLTTERLPPPRPKLGQRCRI